ncbi:MAG: HD domain-containing protein [Cuniculiplasma sp.]
MFKAIQDPVWGYTEIPEKFLRVIDTQEFQRLHWIRQLGMCYLVYPGAVHTRFQHSLGTMVLAQQIGEKLGTQFPNEVAAAALLHDVGHFPFSHSFEDYFEKKFKTNHEKRGIGIVNGKIGSGEINENLIKENIDPEIVGIILSGTKEEFALESSIISGPLDADEMDYLVRDSYFTGTDHLSFSLKRIIDILRTDGERIYIEEKGVTSIESVLISRLLMYKSVYFHKTVRIAQKMIEKTLYKLKNPDISYLSMHDDLFLSTVGQREQSSGLINMINKRKLYKMIYRGEAPSERKEEVERRLLEAYPELIIDYIPPYSFKDRKRSKDEVIVKQENGFKDISSISPLLNSLYDSFNRRYFYVYGPENIEITHQTIENLLS